MIQLLKRTVLSAAFVALSPLPARAALNLLPEPPCFPVGANRLNCPSRDIELIVDTLTRCEADRDKLKLGLDQARLDLAACQAELAKWPSSCPVPPPPPKKDPLWPVLGYVGGVVGTLALAAVFGLAMPEPVRWGVGLAGAATMSISVIWVLP